MQDKEKQWLERYSMALELAQNGRNEEAVGIFENLIKNKTDTSENNISAAFVTLGSCYLNSIGSVGELHLISTKAEECARNALKMNPDNKIAPQLLARSLLGQKKYIEAAKTVAMYDVKMGNELETSLFQNQILIKSSEDKDFFDALLDIYYDNGDSLYYTLLIINAAVAAGYYMEASSLIRECLKSNLDQLSDDTKISLASSNVWCHTCIAGKREIQKSIEKLDEFLEKYGKGITEITDFTVIRNKAAALVRIGDMDQLQLLLKGLPDECKENTFLYTLAKAYLDTGNYKEALRLGWSAMQMKKDDTDYVLVGRAYMGLEKYEKAIEVLKKAVVFVQNGKEEEYSYNDITIGSLTSDSKEERLNGIYRYLIQAYICNEQHEYAKAVLERMKSNGEDPAIVFDAEILLKIEENISGKVETVKTAYDKLSEEFEKQETENSKLKKNMSDWYRKLVNCQDVNDLEIIDDETWNKEYSEKMEEVIRAVSRYCIYTRSKDYQSQINRINKRFPNLNKTTRSFLATAEQIYLTFEKEDMMDYAPVMVEYARFLETLLWGYINNTPEYYKLAEKNKRYNNQGETLGAATHTISKKDGPLIRYYKKIDWIRENRNRSAHINVSREPEVKAIREYIWESDIVDVLSEKI